MDRTLIIKKDMLEFTIYLEVLPDRYFIDIIFLALAFITKKKKFNTVLTLNTMFYITDNVALII